MKNIICGVWLLLMISGCATPYSIANYHLTADEKQKILKVAPALSDVEVHERMEIPNLPKEAISIIQRELVVRQHPEWSNNVKMLIRKGKVVIGMTNNQVLASLGEPNDINRTVTKYGVHEQWVYGYYDLKCVYLDDNVVTCLQD